jgi:hypothetical protein
VRTRATDGSEPMAHVRRRPSGLLSFSFFKIFTLYSNTSVNVPKFIEIQIKSEKCEINIFG